MGMSRSAVQRHRTKTLNKLRKKLKAHLPEGIANLMIPIAVYVAMFFVDWKLALLSLASIPISLIAMMTMYSVGMKKMGPYYMAGQKMNNTIIEYINGMEVVKVFNKDADSYERFRKDVSDYRDYTLAWYKAAWPWMAIYSSLLPCTIILTLPVGAWFVLSGWATLPNLILVLCLSLSIGMPLLKSLGFLPTMPQLNYKISALEQVLDAPELQQTEDAFHGKDDTITYDHVSFAYQTTQPGPDGKPVVTPDEVLHDISFTAKAGQKTALVGESGSGKSTLAKLLIHYYDPQKGSISIGGQKLCDMSLEALNSRVSYVAQDQYLFNTSLLENIWLGRLNATDEEVVEAAKKAQCMEFLEKLPQGIHSMAGDAGKMLSGGQRQRISLARAILKDAPIVLEQSGALSLAYVLGVLLFVFDLFGPLKALYGEASRLTVMNAALDRIEAVLDEPELSDNGKQHIPVQAQPGQPEVQFNDVTFAYQDEEVLHHINFAMKKNSMTALVGPSGSGKSTIANLLARLWDVKSGNVTIRGVDIRNVALSELMDQISMVFQRVYLFQDTIYNNISMGKPDARKKSMRLPEKPAAMISLWLCLMGSRRWLAKAVRHSLVAKSSVFRLPAVS